MFEGNEKLSLDGKCATLGCNSDLVWLVAKHKRPAMIAETSDVASLVEIVVGLEWKVIEK
jgi:hypothetical protein